MPERRPPRRGDKLATFVRRRREALGLDQHELAERVGERTRHPITRLEAGYLPVAISAPWVESYARALEVSPEVLVAEGELHRYLGIPASMAELSPGRQLLLAAVAGLSDEQVREVARALSLLLAALAPEPTSPPTS